MKVKFQAGLVLLVLALLANASVARAQDDPDKFIARLMEQMSPRAKVGQLFVVSFPDTDVGPDTDVATLIREYKVGGLVLSTAAGNIVNTGSPPLQVAQLTASLQGLASDAAQADASADKPAPFIPLFVAVSYDSRLDGTTPLPPPLALGATWKRDDAYAVGKLAGQELAALGINVVLGPSFDLLSAPAPGSLLDLQALGGDPYWVGVLGQAFVRGVREGSSNRVVTAVSHFPGQAAVQVGETAIDKSLDDLKQRDLLPFLRVMAVPASGERPVVDALLVSQARYRGFAGNFRELTRPLVVDTQAMQSLLESPQVKAWRDAGGVLFSDALGSPALRHYYEARLRAFPAQRVAQDAFLAGNDVLVLSGFEGEGWPVQFEAITDTMAFFQDKYSTDLAFQTRVNDAVARILRLKYRLYPGFEAASVPIDTQAASGKLGLGQDLVAQVARDALSRLWPAPGRAELGVPSIGPQDVVVILTDERALRDCSTCAPVSIISTDALSRTLVQRYGPAGRIDPARVFSLGLGDVQAYLEGQLAEGAPDVGAMLGAANWVVLVLVDTSVDSTASLLQQLLVERPEVLGGKRIVALSLGSPYALDKSQVARLTAYYGLYGSSPPFVEVAAQALLGDLPMLGAPPVSIPAIGYDLVRQTEPDPTQFIQVFIGEAPGSGTTTPQPLSIKVGDTLKLRTGLIVDRNGQPVPDGTPVTFTRVFSEGIDLPALTVGTRDGTAVVEFVLEKIGPLRIRAFSEPALTSYELRLIILEGQQVTLEAIAPPTLTPTPVPPTPTATPLPTVTPSPTPTPVPHWSEPLFDPAAPRRVGFTDLLAALVGILCVSGVAYRAALLDAGRADSLVVAARWALGCGGAGLIGYVLYSVGAPGVALLDSLGSAWAALIASVLFAALPLAAGLAWQRSTAKMTNDE